MESKEAEDLIQKYGGDWENDRKEAAKIREDAIKSGAWPQKLTAEETVEVICQEDSIITDTIDLASSSLYLLSGGFLLGAIVTTIFFSVKIKHIKKDFEIRLNEARSAVDHILKIATKD